MTDLQRIQQAVQALNDAVEATSGHTGAVVHVAVKVTALRELRYSISNEVAHVVPATMSLSHGIEYTTGIKWVGVEND